MNIQLDPQWIALKAQCINPYLTEVYENLTLQLLNGYCGTMVAIDSFYKAIQNPYIGKTVVELTPLRTRTTEALYAYPFPEGNERIELERTMTQLNEAHSFAVRSKNFGV